jgi:beta-glucosidase
MPGQKAMAGLVATIFLTFPAFAQSQKPKYLNPKAPIEERIHDLLSRMTIEEKIAELQCTLRKIEWGQNLTVNGLGGVGPLLRPYVAEEAAEKGNEIQKLAMEKTRLGIPVIFHDEALHGLVGNKATSFPQAIGLAATWDTELVARVATVIGKETRARGIRQVLSPVVNIARDARWGRVEETYGEDPYLQSRLAVAFCKNIENEGVITTPKHFVANVGDGGRDSYPIFFSERELREVYFPPFKAAFQEGNAWSVMASYNAVNGVPCSADKWLLTDILRKEWGFKGFVVSDYGSVAGIMNMHFVAATPKQGAIKAVEAGLDMELPDIYCYGAPLLEAAKDGSVSMETIDDAVKNILRAKFRLGLFENPYVDPKAAAAINDAPEHRALAREAAREAIVLLKNEGNVLPLKKEVKSMAVIGPQADVVRLGGYSGFGMKTVTILEGIKNKLGPEATVYHEKGCDLGFTWLPPIPSKYLVPPDAKPGEHGPKGEYFKNMRLEYFENKGSAYTSLVWDLKRETDPRIQAAVDAAKKSDVAVVVFGIIEGEGYDRANLDLPGEEERLIKSVSETGTPIVVVLINGSAVTMKSWIDKVSAVVEAWYPGEEGGNAVADVLFGDYNPGGKLPMTFPQSVGQVPLYYNHKPTGRGNDYADMSGKPLFPFGFGLSYTTFTYGNLQITPSRIPPYGKIYVSVDVQNSGDRKGEEVIQLYLHDPVASVTRPVKELKGFKRILLAPNEKKTVTFELTQDELGFFDGKMKYVVEPGMIEVMIGSSSDDIRLKSSFEVIEHETQDIR